jgi:O-antigen/teichoic acid export membrane protein
VSDGRRPLSERRRTGLTEPSSGDERRSAGSAPLRTLASGSILTIGGVIATGILNFLVVIAVTRGLRAEGTGAFFQAVALFSILASLADLGASAGIVRSVARYLALGRVRDVRRVYGVAAWPVAAIVTVAALCLLLMAPVIASVLGLDREQGPVMVRTIAVFLPLAAVSSVALAAIRGSGRMLPYVALDNVFKPALRPILVIVALILGAGAPGVLLAWLLPVGLALPIAALVVSTLMRRLPGDPSASDPSPHLAAEFWRFSAPRGVAGAFQVAIVWLDVLLLGSLRSTTEAGLYGAVGRLVGLGVFAIEGVRLAIAPQISGALAAGDEASARLQYRVGTWWLMALSWPMYLGLAIFAPVVLRLFGPEFVQGQMALVILSLAMLIGASTGNVTVVLLMGGKSVWALANTAVALVVNVVLNLMLIPSYGMTGAAIAWAASILAINLLPLWQVWRFLRLDPFGRGFLIIAAISMACYGGIGLLVRAALGDTLVGLAVYGLVATVVYAVFLHRFREPLRLPIVKQALRRATSRWFRPTPQGAESKGPS